MTEQLPIVEKDVADRIIHEPHCNTACIPSGHHLSTGIGMPHIHRTDLAGQCGACVTAGGSDA